MPAAPRESPGLRPLLLAGLALAAAVVYWQVPTFGFVGIDDGNYVAGNPRVLTGLSPANVAWAASSFHASNWHPLTWISLMLDAELGGPGPAVFHRTNLLLHVANTLLLFLALVRLTRASWRSALVAALFAVHPLHVESVAWVSERKDVLSTLFWFLTLLAWARYTERPGALRYASTALIFGLGLLAKPMLVTLPFVLMLLDQWPLDRHPGPFPARVRRSLVEKLPLIALAAASSAVTLQAQAAGGAMRSIEGFPLGMRIANAVLAYASYLTKMVWPADLSVLYPYDRDLSWVALLGAAALLAAVTASALRLTFRRPYLIVGWLWYLGTLVPVIGLVQVGEEPLADRYTYVPLIGIFIMIVWGVPDLLDRLGAQGKSRRVRVGAAAVIVLIALGWTARTQTGVWRDSEALFGHAIAVNPDNPRALVGLAVHRIAQGRSREAITHLRRSLQAAPENVSAMANLGAALLQVGEPDEAVTWYRRAIDLQPEDHDLHSNLGIALTGQGAFDEAEAAFEAALRIAPAYIPAHRGFGLLLARRGDPERALAHLEQAVRGNPGFIATRLDLAIVLDELGRRDQAESELREVLRRDPLEATAHKRLGMILARRGALDDAIAELSESLRIDPDQPALREDLRRVREFRNESRR